MTQAELSAVMTKQDKLLNISFAKPYKISPLLNIHLYLEGIFQPAALTLMVMATMKVTTTMSAVALKNSIRKYYMNERCTLKFSEKGGHAYMMFTSEWSGGIPK